MQYSISVNFNFFYCIHGIVELCNIMLNIFFSRKIVINTT